MSADKDPIPGQMDVDGLIADINAEESGDNIRAAINEERHANHAELRAALTTALALEQINATVVGVEIFGHGINASVNVYISGDLTLTFDKFGEISKPQFLTSNLMAQLGIVNFFKDGAATVVGSLIYKLGNHTRENAADETAREWGREFLRLSASGNPDAHPLDLKDRQARWEAFCTIANRNPQSDGGVDQSAFALARACYVPVTTTGVRLVRCGWYLAYVKREAGTQDPAALMTRMARVGWPRPGKTGQIKAVCPDNPEDIHKWRFYTVPAGWEDR